MEASNQRHSLLEVLQESQSCGPESKDLGQGDVVGPTVLHDVSERKLFQGLLTLDGPFTLVCTFTFLRLRFSRLVHGQTSADQFE